jgi:hypothetical protein
MPINENPNNTSTLGVAGGNIVAGPNPVCAESRKQPSRVQAACIGSSAHFQLDLPNLRGPDTSPQTGLLVGQAHSRNKFHGARLALIAVLLILVAGLSTSAQAATIPFTFELTYDVFIVGVPSPSTLTLPTTVSGSGSFAPFGPAIYSEAGTVTFESSPSGELVTSTVTNNLIASFNGGTDTFTGTHSHVFGVSDTWTILGGTGIFSGATGFATPNSTFIEPSGNPDPNFIGTVVNSGNGQITAPGLNAVPEPATMALLITGLAGVAAMRKRRRS